VRPKIAVVGVAVALLSLGMASGTRAATLWTYPGTCGTATLQACIDNAAAGDTIALAANDLSGEGATIGKSLTLTAATGFTPVLNRVSVYDGGASGAFAVVLNGFRATDIDGTYTGGTGHSLSVSHVRIVQTDPNASYPGISLDAAAPSSLTVTSSYVSFTDEWAGIELAGSWTGTSTFRAVGNYITALGATYAGSGIELDATGSAQLHADIMNNVIWDVANCNCGGASGLFLYPQDTSTSRVNLVGNTFEAVKSSAVGVRNGLAAGGHGSLYAYNNIFDHSTGAPMYLDDSGSAASALFALAAGYNDVYANGLPNILDGRSAGSHNLAKSPKFVSPSFGDMRLSSTSPLLNVGQVCSPGGVAMPDASGHNRLYGASVDLGAYERGAGAPGLALLGTSGPDTLTGGSGNDILCGYGGNDKLSGGAGNDYIDGWTGNDTISGGSGNDILYGDAGADTLSGGSGNDRLCARDGVRGNDHLSGGTGTDSYQADTGDVRVSVEHAVTCP